MCEKVHTLVCLKVLTHLHESGDDKYNGDDSADGGPGDPAARLRPALTNANVAMESQQRGQPDRGRVKEHGQGLVEEQLKTTPRVRQKVVAAAQSEQKDEKWQGHQTCGRKKKR